MGQTFPVNELSIGAGATVSALLGSTIEYQNRASVLTVYGNADAVGLLQTFFMNDGQTTITIIPPGSGISVASTVGAIKANENFLIQYAIPAGEHLVHQITNPTVGAVKVNFLYVIT
jgi:hypothetical protein